MRTDSTGTNWWDDFWDGMLRFFGGFALAMVGFSLAMVAGVASILSPGFTIGLQAGLTVGMYGVAMVGSVFSGAVKSDMDRIHWDMFNSDENAVLDSSFFSFYKGVPVIRYDGERSGTFGIMFLQREGSDLRVDTVKHEWGHIPQLLILGPLKFGIFIGIPSALELGKYFYGGNYYRQPWEASADFFGGAYHEGVTQEDKMGGLRYVFYIYQFPFNF